MKTYRGILRTTYIHKEKSSDKIATGKKQYKSRIPVI